YRDRGLSLQDALIEGGRHRLRPILMTAFATMLALVPLAVTGGGGGVGGLFTSTALTLVLVPVLYSLASRFAGARTGQDLDALLDAAEDRRFKPLGMRGPSTLGLPSATKPPAPRDYDVSLAIEPEPGQQGDPAVLDALVAAGFVVEPIAGTRKMRIAVPNVSAASNAEASNKALWSVRRIVPEKGYQLTEYDVTQK